MAIAYRWIGGADLKELEPTIIQMGWTPLDPAISSAIVALDGDRIVGFAVFRMVPTCGPMFVEKDYRGQGLPDELSGRLFQFLAENNCRGFMVVPESQFTERICKQYGMQQLDNPLYVFTGDFQ